MPPRLLRLGKQDLQLIPQLAEVVTCLSVERNPCDAQHNRGHLPRD